MIFSKDVTPIILPPENPPINRLGFPQIIEKENFREISKFSAGKSGKDSSDNEKWRTAFILAIFYLVVHVVYCLIFHNKRLSTHKWGESITQAFMFMLIVRIYLNYS
jgi:hypothetical protein